LISKSPGFIGIRGLFVFAVLYLQRQGNGNDGASVDFALQVDGSPVVFTACFTMESPRPVPPLSLERLLSTRKNRSNTRYCASLGMPMPVSDTVILAFSLSFPTRTVTLPAGWLYLIAFQSG
jgi:hypothetical protein